MAIVSNGRDGEALYIRLTDNECEPGRMLIGILRILGQNGVLLMDLATGAARSHYRRRALTGHFLAAGVIRQWVHGRQAKKRRRRSPKHQDNNHNQPELSAPLHAEGSKT
jgi:hypothetical protein